MSKSVAIIDKDSKVIAINEYADNYELASNEILVTNPAFIDGDFYEGFFYPEQPFSSWLRDGQGNWQAPIPYPNDGLMYQWDEEAGNWVAVVFQQEN